MSEQSRIQRKISKKHQNTRPPNPSLTSHRRTCISRRSKSSKPITVDLHRCRSVPILWTVGVFLPDDDQKDSSKLTDVFSRPRSCLDIFGPPSMSRFPYISYPENNNKTKQSYNKDAKVVVNVTVEGSPGPVRSLVKLGASVEDTIKLIVDKYSEEGRSPQFARDGVSSFELHHSHFSLESIDKKDTIGNVGTRSFYLRRSCSGRSSNEDGTPQLVSFSSATDQIILLKPSSPTVSTVAFMPTFMARNMSKIGRRMRKLWTVFTCGP